MRLIFSLLLFISFASAASAAAIVQVIDGDTVRISDVTYRINGIDAPERAQTCMRNDATWRCGAAAKKALEALIDGRPVQCADMARDRYDRVIAECRVDGVDLGKAMVRQGHAWAYLKFSDRYAAEQSAARAEGRGVWSGEAEAPWDFRAKRWRVAAQSAPDGCAIKGNISDRGRIYHAPWSRSYDRTKISPAKGERWFCDEAEAIAAGWRAPLR